MNAKRAAPFDGQTLCVERGLHFNALVVCYSGVFSRDNVRMWVVSALAQCADASFLGQSVPEKAMIGDMLPWLTGSRRLALEAGPPGRRFPWTTTADTDVGVEIYLQDAFQRMHMGVGTNRRCMFLTISVSVIASRQPSFKFAEDQDCGVLVYSVAALVAAFNLIGERRCAKRVNVLRCERDYIDAPWHHDAHVKTNSLLRSELVNHSACESTKARGRCR